MKNYRKEIAKSIAKAAGVDEESAGRSLAMPKGGQADLCSTIAFEIAKKKKENPAAICARIISSSEWPTFISKVEAAGPYINFYFSNNFWAKTIGECAKGSFCKLKAKKKAIVEFPSVNPNKPWHVGHLRNAVLGDCIANLLSYRGYDVKRIDYIDDLGLQVAQSFWASKNLPPPKGFENSKYFLKADHVCGWQYVEAAKLANDGNTNAQIRSLLKEMEEGKSATAHQAREFAISIVKAQYQTAFELGIFHDALIFESDIMKTVFSKGVEMIKKSGALEYEKEGKNAGCWVMRLEGAKGFEGMENADKILIRSDGTVTYTGKDVAFQMWKFSLLKNDFLYVPFAMQPNSKTAFMSSPSGKAMKFGGAGVAINVIGMEQAYPQKVICALLQKMGYEKEAANSVHLAYEHVVLPEGKFSGRAGTWIGKEGSIGFSADELISYVREAALEKISADYDDAQKAKIAKCAANSALRFSMLKSAANQKIIFDLEKSLSLSGDSGPYLQYAFARANSILQKAKEAGCAPAKKMPPAYKFNPEETALLRLMLKWEQTLQACALNYQVHPICDFALEAAASFNKFYSTTKVLGEPNAKIREARLLETLAYASLLLDTMQILGIEKLEKM